MRAADRRTTLIAVAVHLFATRGFSGTTTKAIAEAAGVSEAIIFRHFKSKEDLYHAILREKARQDGHGRTMTLLEGFAKHDDDERFVFHLVLCILESFERDPDFHRLKLYAALERPDLVQVSRRILGMQLFKLLRRYVARRQKAGAFRKGPPELLAFGIMALPMHFGMVTKVICAKRVSTSTRELATTFTQIILDGMRASEAADRTTGNRQSRAPSRRKARSKLRR